MASKYLIYKNRKNEFKKLLDRAVKLDIVSAFVSRNDIFNDTIERAKDGKLTVRLLAGISNAISDPDVLLKKLLTQLHGWLNCWWAKWKHRALCLKVRRAPLASGAFPSRYLCSISASFRFWQSGFGFL
jgi:hypothetical protein